MYIHNYMSVDKKIESYFSDKLTFSEIRDRSSRRIYSLGLPLLSPESFIVENFLNLI